MGEFELLNLEGWTELRQKERKEGRPSNWRNSVSKGKKVGTGGQGMKESSVMR